LNVKEQGELCIFSSKISPGDIVQGKLEDSYFLSALAAIAETPNRVKDMFMCQTIQK
jgi:hypothetical protein